MGWKTRGGRAYFYQSAREGGRVVSPYVDSGEPANLMSKLHRIERERRETQGHDRRAKRERAERLAKRIAKACRTLILAVVAIIEDSGYHPRQIPSLPRDILRPYRL